MSTIDIRGENVEKVKYIKFADAGEGNYETYACELEYVNDRAVINSKEEVEDDRHGKGRFVSIETKEQALNLIKALNKAIELGWLK